MSPERQKNYGDKMIHRPVKAMCVNPEPFVMVKSWLTVSVQ